ncbi:hypothetical protein [Myxococcus sp. Y35]|uniref:hypothetical protein n=1 Tax=Pseudomyxococcus flavus TaxID=3115648 RepID=UPI003CF44161
MKKLLISLVATSSLVFGAGCGGDDDGDEDLCQETANTYNSLADKAEGCPEIADFFSLFELSEEDINVCRESMDSCTDSDKDKIRAFLDCLNDVPRCQSSNLEAWAAEFEACDEKSQGISDACGGVE